MWDKLVSLSEDDQHVIAKLPQDINLEGKLTDNGVEEELNNIGATDFCILTEEVNRFVNCANEGKSEALIGFPIAEVRDAEVEVVLSDHDMLASMVVTGAFRGSPLKGPQIVHALARAHVTKGINKLALKKVLVMSHQLKPGE